MTSICLKYINRSFIFVFLIFSGFSGFATYYSSATSGNWNSASTWNPSGIPVSGDVIQIASGHTITVGSDLIWNSGQITGSGKLVINGNFTYSSSSAINFWSSAELVVNGNFSYQTGSYQINDPQKFTVTGNLSINGAFTTGTSNNVYIGGNMTANSLSVNNGSVNTVGNITLTSGNFVTSYPVSVGGKLDVYGYVEINGGTTIVTSDCTTHTGYVHTNNNATLSIGGNLNSYLGVEANANSTLSVQKDVTITTGDFKNNSTQTIFVGEDLSVPGYVELNTGDVTVNGNLTTGSYININNGKKLSVDKNVTTNNYVQVNLGTLDINGNLTINSGNLSLNNTGALVVVDGNLIKSGDINLNNGNLIVGNDFISNGGVSNMYNSASFYVFGTIQTSGNQAGCTNSCFPNDLPCPSCQIKSGEQWTSNGSPGNPYISYCPWWPHDLTNIGESVGPTNLCPGSTATFHITAITTNVGDINLNLFEWAVYGGTITSNNGSTVSNCTSTQSGHTSSFLSVHGVNGISDYSVTVHWENYYLNGGYVAVRQTSQYGCSDGKWSVYKINLQDITAPTGSSAQSFCEGATVANLSATGLNIKWYTTSSGGSALASNTLLTSGTYYGSQTVSGCESVDRLAVSVTMLATNTVSSASSFPTVCANTAITPITHITTGATGIGSPIGLPTGVSASWASNTITISGIPSIYGVFNYSIPLSGGCGTVTATGTITVEAAPTTASISTTKFNYIGTLTTNTLGGTIPSTGNGVWSITSGGTGTFSAQTNGNSTFTAGSTGSYVLRWTITNGTCSNFAEVTIHFYNETTWNGSTSTAWVNVLNWTPNEVPDGNNSILIPLTANNPVISGSSPANDVSISDHLNIKDGATLTLEAGPVLKLNATANVSTFNDSKIIIKSDGNYINLSTSSPTLKMERLLTGVKGWRMVSSPVSTTYSDMFKVPLVTQGFTGSTYPLKQPNLLLWDETDAGTSLQSWRNPGGFSSAIPAGEGHFHYIFNGAGITEGGTYSDVLPQTMTVTGNENALGGHSFSLTYTLRDLSSQSSGNYIDRNIADQGWNLKGNPTASTLDWDLTSGWTKTNIDNTIYIWDPSANGGNGEYLTWNGISGTLGNGRIAPFQAFWVHANTTSPGLSFTNLAKSTVNGNFLKTASIDNSVIVPITLSGEGMQTTSILLLSENGVTGPDTWDGYRLEPMSDSWLALYMRSSLSYNEPLVINDLPLSTDNEYIPLYVDAQKDGQKIGGSFTIQWEIPKNWPEELSLQLMDHTQKKAISMLQVNEYEFDQIATKNAVIEAIDPLNVPTQLIKYNNTENKLKTTESLPFSIVIGRNTIDPVYQDKVPVLFTNYPNPFSESTTIRFSLPDTAPVQIDIFDVYGRLLETPFKGSLPSGIHNVDWTPATNVSGILFIRLTSNKTVLSVKALKKR